MSAAGPLFRGSSTTPSLRTSSSAQSPAKSVFLASLPAPPPSPGDARIQRPTQQRRNERVAIRSSEDDNQSLFDQVQQYCCKRTSTTGFSDITKQYVAAHKRLISRYCSRFHQQADIPSWSDRKQPFHEQLQRHVEDFVWWLKSYSYTPVSKFQPLCSELCPALSAQSNAFDVMRERGIDLHDAYIMDTSGDGSPTFAVYREMQELAPAIIDRILGARVMELTAEEERSAIGAALGKKRKRASEQLDECGM